jgi:hypothetical protein
LLFQVRQNDDHPIGECRRTVHHVVTGIWADKRGGRKRLVTVVIVMKRQAEVFKIVLTL